MALPMGIDYIVIRRHIIYIDVCLGETTDSGTGRDRVVELFEKVTDKILTGLSVVYGDSISSVENDNAYLEKEAARARNATPLRLDSISRFPVHYPINI